MFNRSLQLPALRVHFNDGCIWYRLTLMLQVKFFCQTRKDFQSNNNIWQYISAESIHLFYCRSKFNLQLNKYKVKESVSNHHIRKITQTCTKIQVINVYIFSLSNMPLSHQTWQWRLNIQDMIYTMFICSRNMLWFAQGQKKSIPAWPAANNIRV